MFVYCLCIIFSVIELRRPLSLETEATLIWRLPGLSKSCRMIVFLYRGAYFEVDKNALPSKVTFGPAAVSLIGFLAVRNAQRI
jgi:hypothetical protein